MTAAQIETEDFDRMFDGGEDAMDHIDTSAARAVWPGLTSVKRVNVGFPEWMVNASTERPTGLRQAGRRS